MNKLILHPTHSICTKQNKCKRINECSTCYSEILKKNLFANFDMLTIILNKTFKSGNLCQNIDPPVSVISKRFRVIPFITKSNYEPPTIITNYDGLYPHNMNLNINFTMDDIQNNIQEKNFQKDDSPR
jgi:hypothetical protein